MEPLSLDDLPKHSAWASYLLDPRGDPPDDPGAYTRTETYEELYARLLESYRANPVGADAFVREVRATGRADPGAISVDEALYLASPEELVARERTVVRDALAPFVTGGETVVDLGCGWGATLGTIADAFPDATVIGGEYSARGVELARELHAARDRIAVEPFDFHGDRGLVDAGTGDVVVFTKAAVTTLTSVDSVVDRFASLASAGDVVGGVHLEPVDVHPETVLGLLRRRYGRVRGYNGELLDELERRDALTVTDVTYDALGANPLHPSTAIRWRPR